MPIFLEIISNWWVSSLSPKQAVNRQIIKSCLHLHGLFKVLH